MLKWIKNSKSKGFTGKKGIVFHMKNKNYKATVSYYNSKTNKTEHLYIGVYETLKEAENKRVNYILSLL